MILSKRDFGKEFSKDGIAIVWVQSAGSNKALDSSTTDFDADLATSAAAPSPGRAEIDRAERMKEFQRLVGARRLHPDESDAVLENSFSKVPLLGIIDTGL